jgi:hypothetical protein
MAISKKILLSCIVATSLAAPPAAQALGIVSRSCAPAGAQESITVDWGFVVYSLWTASSHYANGAFLHTINTVPNTGSLGGWENTWRSRAGHFGEYWYGNVIGYHYKRTPIVAFMGNSYASDCNLAEWGGS